jgi:hypothetical protein
VATAQAQAAKPRIAVMSVKADRLGGDVRDKLAAAVAGGLAAAGAEVVDSAATARRLAARGIEGCETSTCRVAIADATGARYLMRGNVETMGRSYTVHLEMIDGTTGAVIGVREDRCEICTENEVYETASVTASALKAEVLKRPGTGPTDPPTHPLRPITDPTTPKGDRTDGLTIVSPGSGSGTPGEPRAPRLRALSWIGIGAGAVAIGAGIYLLSINHDLTCTHAPGDNCEFRYKTRTWGIVSITGGALAAALGTTLLVGRF